MNHTSFLYGPIKVTVEGDELVYDGNGQFVNKQLAVLGIAKSARYLRWQESRPAVFSQSSKLVWDAEENVLLAGEKPVMHLDASGTQTDHVRVGRKELASMLASGRTFELFPQKSMALFSDLMKLFPVTPL